MEFAEARVAGTLRSGFFPMARTKKKLRRSGAFEKFGRKIGNDGSINPRRRRVS
jgi:hypothetical protein